METFWLGQEVRIKAEFSADEEKHLTFIIVELRGDRCVIEPIKWDYPIPPQECVELSILEVIS